MRPEFSVSVHPHPLQLTQNQHQWCCDGKNIGGCKSGITTYCVGARYRCEKCDFDLCYTCFSFHSNNNNNQLALVQQPYSQYPTPYLPVQGSQMINQFSNYPSYPIPTQGTYNPPPQYTYHPQYYPPVLTTYQPPAAYPPRTPYIPVGPNRIKKATSSMQKFIEAVFGSGDRCSITTFNDDVDMKFINESNESTIISTLASLEHQCQGGTKLYDAICFSIFQFLLLADRSRPWVLVVLTDGEDNRSQNSLTEAKKALQYFNSSDSNFTFIIGIGNSVNEEQMKLLTSTGSLYVPATKTDVLETIFALIALQIQTLQMVSFAQLSGQNANIIFGRAQEMKRLRRQPIDIVLVVDISQSMTEYN